MDTLTIPPWTRCPDLHGHNDQISVVMLTIAPWTCHPYLHGHTDQTSTDTLTQAQQTHCPDLQRTCQPDVHEHLDQPSTDDGGAGIACAGAHRGSPPQLRATDVGPSKSNILPGLLKGG